MPVGKVIYLTGAPASGKSSTTRLLRDVVPELQVWEYGARLTEYVRRRSDAVLDQNDLRSQSAQAVTAEDVQRLDDELLEFVARERTRANVIIDSHAVTKEAWGFRVVPFSLARFAQLAPDEIWMLFTGPATAVSRIEEDPGGRPVVSEEEARMHTHLQASVAATYAMSLGVPLYLFDSSGPQGELVRLLADRLS